MTTVTTVTAVTKDAYQQIFTLSMLSNLAARLAGPPAALQQQRARQTRTSDKPDGAGANGAVRRIELLRLRFEENLPIRRIAELWEEDPVQVHREYARARQEFRDALIAVMAFNCTGTRAHVEAECAEILRMLA